MVGGIPRFAVGVAACLVASKCSEGDASAFMYVPKIYIVWSELIMVSNENRPGDRYRNSDVSGSL